MLSTLLISLTRSFAKNIVDLLPVLPQTLVQMHQRRPVVQAAQDCRMPVRRAPAAVDVSRVRWREKRTLRRAARLGPGQVLYTSPLRQSASAEDGVERVQIPIPRIVLQQSSDECEEPHIYYIDQSLFNGLYRRPGGLPMIPLHVKAISNSMVERQGVQDMLKWEAMNEIYLQRRRDSRKVGMAEKTGMKTNIKPPYSHQLKPVTMGEQITRGSFVPYRHVLVANLKIHR